MTFPVAVIPKSCIPNAVVYLLRDEFVTAEAAPLTSPRVCEPGPGTLVVSEDPNNKLHIEDGQLHHAYDGSGQMATIGSDAYYGAGQGLFHRIKQSYNNGGGCWIGGTFLVILGTQISINYRHLNNGWGGYWQTNISTDPFHVVGVVLTGERVFVIIDEEIVWVEGISGTVNGARCQVNPTTQAIEVDWIRIAELAGVWKTDWGMAVARMASAGAGAALVGSANGTIEATWQAATDETFELSFRRTDDDNRWVVRCSQADGTIKLIEINAGVETERSSAAQTWTNGVLYRVSAMPNGSSIRTMVQSITTASQPNAYDSGTFNQSATGAKVSHAVTNLISWPRAITGAALYEYRRYFS